MHADARPWHNPYPKSGMHQSESLSVDCAVHLWRSTPSLVVVLAADPLSVFRPRMWGGAQIKDIPTSAAACDKPLSGPSRRASPRHAARPQQIHRDPPCPAARRHGGTAARPPEERLGASAACALPSAAPRRFGRAINHRRAPLSRPGAPGWRSSARPCPSPRRARAGTA